MTSVMAAMLSSSPPPPLEAVDLGPNSKILARMASNQISDKLDTSVAEARQNAEGDVGEPGVPSSVTDISRENSKDDHIGPAMPRKPSDHAPVSPAVGTVGQTANTSSSKRTKGQSLMNTEHYMKLQSLKQLYEEGFIVASEYRERKSQLIDQITGTSSTRSRKDTLSTKDANLVGRGRLNSEDSPAVDLDTKQPDWNLITEEPAIQHIFDPITHQWRQNIVTVKIAPKPFARGGLRFAYYMKLCSKQSNASHSLAETVYESANTPANDQIYVAKMSIDPFEDRETYFQDVQIQMYVKEWAAKYNSYNPPKKIDFVKAYCLELVNRPGRPIVCIERFIEGEYRKHNNNFGYVSEDERNTPQAFSHFTYHASKHTVLVCDIQGVGDLYTDPVIHTILQEDFGKGNMGQRGFEKFLSTHRCNAICRYLHLPSINAKPVDDGTLPAPRHNAYNRPPLNFPPNDDPPSPASTAGAELDPSTPLLKPPPVLPHHQLLLPPGHRTVENPTQSKQEKKTSCCVLY